MGRPMGSRNKDPHPRRKTVVRRLIDHPSPTPQPTFCRLWQGRLNAEGYGQRWDRDRQKMVLVHRWVWEQVHGPTDLYVLHHCDQPLCYRYEHLFAGTAADNTRDMESKNRQQGRFRPGEQAPKAKLTQQDVDVIRQRLARGETMSAVARDYSVNRTSILAIRDGRNWKRRP